MRKTTIFILLAISIMAVFADDVVKVLQVYSGEKKISIPISNIDNLNHSMYNADGKLQDEFTSTIIDAIDSTYNIPIFKIDSIVISEIEAYQIKSQIDSIWDYAISFQSSENLSQYQEKLISWLNNKDWVSEVVINDTKNLIIVTFTNGFNFFIDFQSTSYFIENNNSVRRSSEKKETLYIDVSFEKNEEIIDKMGILYVEGRYMPRSSYDEFLAFGGYEYDLLQEEVKKSPVKLGPENIERINKDILELDKFNFSNYGIMIISQTHGYSGDYYGSFQIATNDWWSPQNLELHGMTIYYTQSEYENYLDPINWFFIPKYVYRVTPKYLSKIIGKNLSIIYGNYCYSYGIKKRDDIIVFGYTNRSEHEQNIENLTDFISNLLKGKTFEDAIYKSMMDYDFNEGKETIHCIPKTNYRNSKLRYFSIKTEDVTEFSKTGNPIIKGQINGFKNLKSDINYYVYVFDKDEELNHADITTKGKLINKETFSKADKGTFSFEYPDLTFTETPEEYQFVVGFTYGGVTYYGSPKTLRTKGFTLCPVSNHPHWIDLGLPSGTLWRCCNEGASTPEAYGSYYTFGEVSSAPSLDQIKELLENTTSVWTIQNGVNGRIFTGRNGGTIFLPAAGIRWFGKLDSVGEYGNYISSTPYGEDGAYGLCFGSGSAYWGACDGGDCRRYWESVRPVR